MDLKNLFIGYAPKNKNANFDWISLYDVYRENVKDNFVVVEIGASSIIRTTELAKLCKKLIGLEKYKNRIPKSINVINLNYQVGKWEDLSKIFEEGSIDIIIASHVIEHIENDLLCINQSYKVLKNDGILLFNTPNRKRLTRSIIEFFKGERKFPFWEHIREYIKPDLQVLIEASKFDKTNTEIKGIVFGLHSGKIFIYIKKVPRLFEKYSNFWQIKLIK